MKYFYATIGVIAVMLAAIQSTWQALLPDNAIYYTPLVIAILALAYYLLRRH